MICIIFFKFFWSCVHLKQNEVKKWFKKFKKKNLHIFLTKLTFLVRHRFWVSKNEKMWLFSTFFRKHEKSCFAQISCKSLMCIIFFKFFWSCVHLKQNEVKKWFKKFKKKNLYFYTTKLRFLVRHRFWVCKNEKKLLFSTFFRKHEKSIFEVISSKKKLV